MYNAIGFAEVAGAIIAAMGLAMWLEWLTLRAVLRLMPPKDARPERREGSAIDLRARKTSLKKPPPVLKVSGL